MIRNIVQFFKKLTQHKSVESSKRFMALATMLIIYYIVLRFTNNENVELILAELLSFILVLSGVSVYEKINKKEDILEK